MLENPQDTPQLSDDEVAELLRSLLHKEGDWVEWGKKCQKLQKAGKTPQSIFEQTGFQGVQQNLIIVASQVFESLVREGVSEEILTYFRGPRSDVLYEFRILNHELRAAAAELAKGKSLDADSAKEVAKAVQEFSRLSQFPSGFTNHPGDAIAYQCWKRARQKKDLQERSRLIAQGLKFAHSPTAREKIEQLLSDFTVVTTRTAPLMPIYRLEIEEALARIIPVVGTFPITKQDLESVISFPSEEPFQIVRFSGSGSMISLPGWQVVLKALDPVAIICNNEQLPKSLPGKVENVLVVIDRGVKEWDVNSYFAIEQEGKVVFQWFAENPNLALLGQVIIVLRPKNIFDENNILEPWQMDD
jgi:hypothetical protein